MEKSEAVKTNRLKAAYLEKIVPLLKEEFSYQNIHEVTPFSLFKCARNSCVLFGLCENEIIQRLGVMVLF